ncbi:hypothetical protein [Vibrio sp. D431a]|uniref:hypothetical protein n=1 Tax=Vibrio sp. D431a TaxID=2837388 RepID=UPI0025533EC5|nr:hypothetical protein [Vibrio sp. D431a]MDK9793791.1 hypothetical protein [Vibrio sp. D431a]
MVTKELDDLNGVLNAAKQILVSVKTDGDKLKCLNDAIQSIECAKEEIEKHGIDKGNPEPKALIQNACRSLNAMGEQAEKDIPKSVGENTMILGFCKTVIPLLNMIIENEMTNP